METNPTNQSTTTEQIPLQTNQHQITNEGITASQEQIPIIPTEQGQTVVIVKTQDNNSDNNQLQQNQTKYFRKKLQSPEQSCCFGAHDHCCHCCHLWTGAHIWIVYFLIVYVINLIGYIRIMTVLTDEHNTHTLPNCDSDMQECDERKIYEDAGLSVPVVVVSLIITICGIVVNIITCYGLHANYTVTFLLELSWIAITILLVIGYLILTMNLLAAIIELILNVWAFYVFYKVWKWSVQSKQSKH